MSVKYVLVFHTNKTKRKFKDICKLLGHLVVKDITQVKSITKHSWYMRNGDRKHTPYQHS